MLFKMFPDRTLLEKMTAVVLTNGLWLTTHCPHN